jgi:pimeloyl-ACP methyl ester carboxylesterase
MAIYVLIHGGGHGGWCWDKVVPLLRKKGHLVMAPDLPGHGADKTPIQEVTLQSCVDKVCSIINAQSEPVILVGHSLGGIVISQVAEQFPEKIRTLVYLTADLLQDGESLVSTFPRFLPIVNATQNQINSTNKNFDVDIFYNGCSPDDVDRAKSLLCAETAVLFTTPVRLSKERFGRVPRVYIECLLDQVKFPSEQKAMYTATPCQKVFSLNTGHSPFLSAPEQLSDYLLSLAD